MLFLGWFESRPDVRLLAGVLFLAILAWLYFRRSQGSGRFIFLAAALILAAVFALSPLAHLLAFLPLFALMIIEGLGLARRQQTYAPAVAVVESGGVKRGLTAPEAAVLMERPIATVVASVLLSLLHKGVLEVAENEPLILQLAEPFRKDMAALEPSARAAARRRTAQEKNVLLHPYEEPFLAVLESSPGIPIRDLNTAAAVRALLRHTARRVRGHSVHETRSYYNKHLGRARHDIELAGHAGPAARAYDRNFDWLLLDSQYAALYDGYMERWLAARGLASRAPRDWMEKLCAAASQAVPEGALTVRQADGRQLALSGDDPVRAEFFEAVIANIR